MTLLNRRHRDEWRDWFEEPGIHQSMSRKADRLVDAATPNRCSALPLKDGLHRGRTFDSYERFKAGLDAYIAHRDTGRCREKPEGHTPEEFRSMSPSRPDPVF